jgi:hypothetical protein
MKSTRSIALDLSVLAHPVVAAPFWSHVEPRLCHPPPCSCLGEEIGDVCGLELLCLALEFAALARCEAQVGEG